MADYKPEELLRKLKNGEELPRLLVVTGEERYYRTRISAAVQQYVFGGATKLRGKSASLRKTPT